MRRRAGEGEGETGGRNRAARRGGRNEMVKKMNSAHRGAQDRCT